MLKIPVLVVCFCLFCCWFFLLVLLLLLKLMFVKLLDPFFKHKSEEKEVAVHVFEGLAQRFIGSGTKDMEFF